MGTEKRFIAGEKLDIFQWDVRNWSRALPLWSSHLIHPPGSMALAIGERDGGLSLMLAEAGYRTSCTDVHPPSVRAHELHRTHGVDELVEYEVQDTTALTYDADRFDVVIFKSVIGALGTKDRQRQALLEMLRVLKPGGVLLFAENLSATMFHRWLRTRFVAWNSYWRYLSFPEDLDLFKGYERLEIKTCGFTANLGRTEHQRDLLASVDAFLAPIVPSTWRYIAYGAAFKPAHP